MSKGAIFSRIAIGLVLGVFVFAGSASAITKDQLYSVTNNVPFYDPSLAPCASGSPTQTAGNTNLASGSSVYILGDSITERTQSTYQTDFQKLGITANVDGQVSRSIYGAGIDGTHTTGMQAIAIDKSEIQAASAIVVGLGTNGGDTPTAIDSVVGAIRAINPNAPLYWIDTITINNPGLLSRIQSANSAIYAEAGKDNYTVISWFKAVDPNGDPTSPTGNETDTNGYIDMSDGLDVHPTIPKGVGALANLVVGALTGSGNSAAGQGQCCNSVTGSTTSSTSVSSSANQQQNAATIIGIAKTENLGENAALIGLMVGIDESSLLNLANQNVPLSEQNPTKQGDGNNGTSLGVFQQQIVDNWSTISSNLNDTQAIAQLMTPAYAAEAFFGSPPGTQTSSALQKGLQNVSGWQSMQPWVAAQQVQHSGTASGANYEAQLSAAQSLLNQLWNSSPAVPLPVPFQAASATNSGVGASLTCTGAGTTASSATYANPFRSVQNLYGQRVDQGVDFDGSGPVYAIGNGVVTNVYNSGWPNGTFINYQLTSGPAKGFYVYMAEDCTPMVQVGQTVNSNTVICNMFEGNSGIETGWGASNNGSSEAAVLGQWDAANNSTGMGVNFLQLLQSLGIHLTGGTNSISQPVQSQGMPSNLPTWQ